MNDRLDPTEFARLRGPTGDFYGTAAELVIEVDGSSLSTQEAKQHDAAGDQWI